jgi:hypothetical protein
MVNPSACRLLDKDTQPVITALGAMCCFAWTFFLIAFLAAEYHTLNGTQSKYCAFKPQTAGPDFRAELLFVSLTVVDGGTAITLYMM